MNYPLNYIDVRSTWPIYFCGGHAFILVGCPRGISVEEARIRVGLDQAAE